MVARIIAAVGVILFGRENISKHFDWSENRPTMGKDGERVVVKTTDSVHEVYGTLSHHLDNGDWTVEDEKTGNHILIFSRNQNNLVPPNIVAVRYFRTDSDILLDKMF